jgi:hypothetical protein
LGKKKIGCKKIYQKQIFARGEELVKKKKKNKTIKSPPPVLLDFPRPEKNPGRWVVPSHSKISRLKG